MPPDRGTVKKTSVKRDSSRDSKPSPSRKNVTKTRTKPEAIKSRDNSVSRSKEKSSKEDRLKTVSSRDKLSSKSRIDSEKIKDINKDVIKDINKLKESLAKNRASKDTRSTSKPTVTPGRLGVKTSTSGASAPLRSQLSYRTASSRSSSEKASKPQADTQSKNVSSTSSTSKVSGPKDRTSSRAVDSRPSVVKKVDKEPARQSRRSEPQPKLGRDRTRTRTLSPREVKIARVNPLQEAEERRAKREAPVPVVVPPLPVGKSQGHGDVFSSLEVADENIDADDDYEDDFEDYESDFEEGTESDVSDEGAGGSELASSSSDAESDIAELSPRPVVEEEKKLDSGNYDLTESKRRGQQELQEIKQALERENAALAARERLKERQVTQPTVATDEGFEEEKLDDSRHVGFINFANAKKRMQEQKVTARAKRRGEQLLDMIGLDVMGFTLLELAPLPYEVYMKNYGSSNTMQAHMQTNEDNLSEETQTEEIVVKNKWSQKPVMFHAQIRDGKMGTNDPLTVFSQDHLGVGGDALEEDPNSWRQRIRVDAQRLDQFLTSAGQVVVRLLEAQEGRGGGGLAPSDMALAFSDGFIPLRVDLVSFLAGRPVTLVRFPARTPTTLLTVHAGVQLSPEQELDTLLGRCAICVWSYLEPSSPHKILVASQEVTAACFEPSHGSLVFAGLLDGSVCLWDLREPADAHHLLHMGSEGWVLRSPTYSTAEILKKDGHLTPVVALQPLAGVEKGTDPSELSELSPMQVCSLEEAGTLMVWTVLQSAERAGASTMAQQDLGLAHWGRVRLVRTATISLERQCMDLQVDSEDPSHLYASTNTGHVLHCLKTGGKPRPRLYSPASEGFALARCIESCSFGQPYFLVGCEDGTVRLHSRWSNKPLTTLAGTGDTVGQGPAIWAIQWTPNRPGIFFVLDSISRIHIWDLGTSDIHPVESVALNTSITSIQLSPDQGDGKGSQHLAVATSCGQVQVHKIKSEFCYQSPAVFKEELERFMLYTSAL